MFIASCVTSERLETTIICGEVVNADSLSPKVLTVFPSSFAGSGRDRYAIDISQSGYKFNQTLSMTHKHDVVIQYNDEFYALMAEPQDSIFVTIDAKSKSILFEGSKALFNTQLHNTTAVVSGKINEIYRFDLEADVEGIVAQLDEKMAVIEESLDSYSATNDIDDDVRRYILDDARYTFANYLLMYDRKNDYSSERYRLFTHETFDIYNPEKAHSYMYAVHLANSMADFMMSDPELREEYQKKDKDITKLSQLLLSKTLQLPKSIMRDITLAKGVDYLQYLSEYLSVSVDSFYDERFLDADNYSNTRFLELYVRPILQPQKVSVGSSIECDFDIESEVRYVNSDRVVENLDDVNIIDYVKERYRGKVIYIDVWATWCGPCMEEMTHAKSLHKMYAERDDIAFVNLCCSSKANNWVKAIERSEIGGENYLVESDDAARMILSAFGLRGYPSYMLVDKVGEIVTTSAFRPSQLDRLSEQLDRLL